MVGSMQDKRLPRYAIAPALQGNLIPDPDPRPGKGKLEIWTVITCCTRWEGPARALSTGLPHSLLSFDLQHHIGTLTSPDRARSKLWTLLGVVPQRKQNSSRRFQDIESSLLQQHLGIPPGSIVFLRGPYRMSGIKPGLAHARSTSSPLCYHSSPSSPHGTKWDTGDRTQIHLGSAVC